MCYFSRLFVIQLKIKIPQTNNCNFDFYVTLNFTEYILWIKHKPQIKYQYILLVDSTIYHILFSDSSECRNNMFKDQFVCCLPVIICSASEQITPTTNALSHLKKSCGYASCLGTGRRAEYIFRDVVISKLGKPMGLP